MTFMSSSLQHWIAHAYNSIHRMTYRLFNNNDETYTTDGISNWVAKPHNLIVWLLEKQQQQEDSNNTMMTSMLTMMMPLLSLVLFPVIMVTLTMLTIMEQLLLVL